MSVHGDDLQGDFENVEVDLQAARDLHIRSLRRVQDEVNNDDIFLHLGAGGIRVRIVAVKSHFDNLSEVHTRCRYVDRNAADNLYLEIETDYLNALAKMETRLDELQLPDRSGPQLQSTMNFAEQMFRMEPTRKPQIGKFNGSPSDWPVFRDLFLSQVHNAQYDPVQKLLYLKEACVGSAAETLGQWRPTAANYQLAWDTLVNAFDDEYHVIHAVLGKMYSAKKQDTESHASLRAILDVLANGTRELLSMANSEALWNQVWIHFAKRRLPATTLDAWEQYRNQNRPTALPTLEQFIRFLEWRARGRREFESEISPAVQTSDKSKRSPQEGSSKGSLTNQRSKPYDRQKSTRDKAQGDSFGFGPAPACIMTDCEQVHYLGQCPNFKRLTLADKLEVVKEHKLCRCCLMEGHMSAICKRRGCSNCPEAKFKHHFLLCTKQMKIDQARKEMAKPTPSTK